MFSQKFVFGNVPVNRILPDGVAVYLWREHGISLFMGLSWLRKTTTLIFTVRISVPRMVIPLPSNNYRYGYGAIIPDLLGQGGTDNPADLKASRLKCMAAELGDLLICEGIDRVVRIARDL